MFGGMLDVVRELIDVELADVESAVGHATFKRGRSYAHGNRVLAIAWDPQEDTLSGSVLGQGAIYSTEAFFAQDLHGELVFADGECSCPVGYNCKHVAALVLAAAEGRGAKRPASAQHRPRAGQTVAAARSWETPLRALIDAATPDATGIPLGIELSVQTDGSPSRAAWRLAARLMRPGARGGWVNGSLAWSGLDSWHVQSGGYRADHLALVRELYAVERASAGRTAYYYGYGSDRTLDLGAWDSSQLWVLLDEARRLGVALVHAHPGLGQVPHHQQGELQIDVTAARGPGRVMRARLVLDGEDTDLWEPVLFLGSSGHGIVCLEDGAERADRRPEHRRLRLVRLAKPAGRPLQQMLLNGEQLEIPAAELERFAEELCPALRSVATVVSSDGSFAPPEISAPALVLRARYGADHAVEVAWEWAYQVGTATRRAPLTLAATQPGFRDVHAERAMLDGLSLGSTGLEQLGLLDGLGRPAGGPAVSLAGVDSMRFTTEDLPRLGQLAGVTVEIEGQPADYRDVGESVTIGVSTAEIAGERDWFDLGVTITVEDRQLPFAEVFAALARGESRMLLRDGAHFSLLEPRLQSLRGLIEEARSLSDSTSAPLRISRYQAGLWDELAALGIVTEQAQTWRRQVDALLDLEVIGEHRPPATLKAELRRYQREGFGWLASLWELELGGILADDMGLGKTLQALALICHARRQDPDLGPFLVIAPTSVVSNWVSEAVRFAPQLRVEPVTDTLARAARTIEEVAAADVVVTTYTLFRLDAAHYGAVSWAGLILDEAQYVKNHQAKTYRCVRELPAPFKLAITGTPMENNLMELWSLLSITAPGLFPDPKRFAEQYARPIERKGDAERLARLRRRIKPLVKRRTKELVAGDLPPKQEQTLVVDLHPRHRKLYDTHLQRERQRILGLIDDFDRNRFTILRAITLLRQLSLHPGLIDERHDGVPCTKLSALAEQLGDVIESGHRALVFSQFTGFLTKVRAQLDQAGIEYCYLDGRTRQRERVLERFKTGTHPVFVISLKAGGFGLNLTEADYCFLLDPWWNPATEAQAIDRTHRIGQTRPVMAYRLISRDTIEEKVVTLARRKAALFSGVMDEGDLFASALTAQDIRGLLG